jgi:membrane protein insertase Oxa1/YidC/SpoIIIJ
LAAGIYLGIAIVAFIPWIQIDAKITAYTSIIALFITIYDSSKVGLKIAATEGDSRKQRTQYVFMLVMKAFMIISPFALLYWINYEDDEAVITRISNYVTFAAIGVVFFTRGMELKIK